MTEIIRIIKSLKISIFKKHKMIKELKRNFQVRIGDYDYIVVGE